MSLGPTMKCPNCGALIPLPVRKYPPNVLGGWHPPVMTQCAMCPWFWWRYRGSHRVWRTS